MELTININKMFKASIPIASTIQLKNKKTTVFILLEWDLVLVRVMRETSSGLRI